MTANTSASGAPCGASYCTADAQVGPHAHGGGFITLTSLPVKETATARGTATTFTSEVERLIDVVRAAWPGITADEMVGEFTGHGAQRRALGAGGDETFEAATARVVAERDQARADLAALQTTLDAHEADKERLAVTSGIRRTILRSALRPFLEPESAPDSELDCIRAGREYIATLRRMLPSREVLDNLATQDAALDAREAVARDTHPLVGEPWLFAEMRHAAKEYEDVPGWMRPVVTVPYAGLSPARPAPEAATRGHANPLATDRSALEQAESDLIALRGDATSALDRALLNGVIHDIAAALETTDAPLRGHVVTARRLRYAWHDATCVDGATCQWRSLHTGTLSAVTPTITRVLTALNVTVIDDTVNDDLTVPAPKENSHD